MIRVTLTHDAAIYCSVASGAQFVTIKIIETIPASAYKRYGTNGEARERDYSRETRGWM
jgi:hypothetical protein